MRARGSVRSRAWLVSVFAALFIVVSALPVLAADTEEIPPPPEVSIQPPGPTQLAEAMAAAQQEEETRERELETPAAQQEQQASLQAYADISPGEARQLLLSSFSENLIELNSDPARFLSDVKLVRAYGDGVATISDDGDGSLLEANIPVRVENEDGALKKVDLDLERETLGFEPENPIVDLEIPESSGEPIAIGDEGLAILPLGADHSGGKLSEKNVFYPEVREDTDLLVAPIASGVELFDQLRSSASPERLSYRLFLPVGAHLQLDGAGGADILRNGEIMASVAPPSAVDSRGSVVPVELEVSGETLTLAVPHRGKEFSYPILVDPAISEGWIGSWHSGGFLEGLGAWRLSGDTEMRYYLASTDCLNGLLCSPSGRGLFVQALDGWIPANTYLQWYYTVPGGTTFIPSIYPTPSVVVNQFHRRNNGCFYEQVPEPHDYAGTFNANQQYTSLHENRAQFYGNATIYDKAKGVAIGLSTRGQGINLPCNRDIMVGGVAIQLDDPENPTLTVDGFPDGWVKAGQSFTITADIYDPGLGVQNVGVYPRGRPAIFHVSQCAGTKVNPCPYSRSARFTLHEGYFDEGEKLVDVSGYDPTWGEKESEGFSNTITREVRVDRTAPTITLAGSLAKATDENKPESEDPEKWDELGRPFYSLGVTATDGSNASPEAKRSGAKRVEIYLDGELAQPPWSLSSCVSSCQINGTYDLQLASLEKGKHELKVVAFDWLEQRRERTIEFEYFPATGDKDEYAMERFPLPDGTDAEAPGARPWPELSVNVATGNVLFEQRDVDVEGPAVDLEVERVYNSLLPKNQDSEWGDGWTMAQTPSLEPATETPDQADVVDASGSIEDEVPLPAEAGQERFDPALQTMITKEADGDYEFDEESAEAGGSIVFDSTGRTQKFLAEGTGDVAEVDYSYEEGELSEIAVEDPTSSSTPPPEPPPVPVQGKPTFATSLPVSTTVADVARDAEGKLWIVDRTQHLWKLGSDGTVEGSYSFSDGFNAASAVAIDGKGNRLVADLASDQVFVIGDSGIRRTIGTPGTGPGQFVDPVGIAVDRKGNIWVTDSSSRLQKFTHSGTFVGAYAGKGSEAGRLSGPKGLDVAPNGEIWVADRGNHRIAVFDESGAFVRNFGSHGEADGQFVWPLAVDFDSRGYGWVASFDGRIQGFSPTGSYYSQFGVKGNGQGQFSFGFVGPVGLVADASGRFWVPDPGNSRIQKWETPNYIPDYTPALASSFGAEGSAPGSLSRPRDIAMGPDGDLWVVDPGKNRVQRFSADGQHVSSTGVPGSEPGQLSRPTAIAFASGGGFWVTDSSNNRIQKFNEQGEFQVQAGSSGTGAGQLSAPEGIAVGPEGKVWVSDTKNSRLQIFSASGVFEKTIGGPGVGPGQFAEPMGLDFGPNGNVYVADTGNHRVQVLDAGGNFVAEFGSLGSASGQFQRPGYVEVDDQGFAWVSDSGNDRILMFGENGEYIRKFGSKGFGPSEFELTPPSGLTSDGLGRIWVVDPGNVRVQKWVTPAYEASELVEAEPDLPNDPAVEVESSEDLIASVEGVEAGTHSYEHAGDDLVAYAGPEGETKYEYNGAGLMTRVELPNGTTATMAYDSLSSRVKTVTLDPAGPEPAKTTSFSYDDQSLKTTVEREGAPKVDYYFDELGAVFKMWHAAEPPEVILSGTLWVEKETSGPINTGLHNLEVQADSAHGIAAIEVIDGDVIVSDKRCRQDPEEPGVECTSESDEWAVETGSLEPGIHMLEVRASDHLDQAVSRRFWVNIPYTPPPDPEAPLQPTFSDIKRFRVTFGLDLDLNPVTQEQALNDRVYDLLSAWSNPNTPEGQVARSSAEKWGVPLRPVDVAEMEYREWYMEHNGPQIDDWGYSHYPESYAGFDIDHAAGGLIRIGFTEDQSTRVGELVGELQLAAEDRISPFSFMPARSQHDLAETEADIVTAMAQDPIASDVIVEVGVSDSGTSILVGASDVGIAERRLEELLDSLVGVSITYHSGGELDEEKRCDDRALRQRQGGRMLAGEAIWTDWTPTAGTPLPTCGTAGFGAYKQLDLRWETVKEPWLLTAGHNANLSLPMYRIENYQRVGKAGFRKAAEKIGHVGRDPLHAGSGTIDALAVDLRSGGLIPTHIWGRGSRRPQVGPAARAKLDWLACVSGASVGGVRCGKVVGFRYYKHKQLPKPVGVIAIQGMSSRPGDSGGPVWHPRTMESIGLHEGRANNGTRFATPLLNTPYRGGREMLHGALDSSAMNDLKLWRGSD